MLPTKPNEATLLAVLGAIKYSSCKAAKPKYPSQQATPTCVSADAATSVLENKTSRKLVIQWRISEVCVPAVKGHLKRVTLKIERGHHEWSLAACP